MALSRLESLPSEVLHQIAELLIVDYWDVSLDMISKMHLRYFAEASRACYTAALPVALRRVAIYAEKKDRQQLKKIIDSWLVTLRRNDNWRHVRRIKVDGTLYGTRGSGFYENGLDDEAWCLVGEMLQLTPHLDEFFFASRNQIPAGLIHALAKLTPKCKLIIPALEIPGAPGDEVTEPGLIALATSPNLHSIRFNMSLVTAGVRDYGRLTHAREIILRILEGSAPNVKDISVYHHDRTRTPQLDEVLMDLWNGTTTRYWDSISQIPPGATKSLPASFTFYGTILFDPWKLDTLTQHADFSALRKFCWYPRGGVSAPELMWAAIHGNFKSLTQLIIKLNTNSGTVMDSAAAVFIASLPPLKELTLHEYASEEIVDSIVNHHGPSLTKLLLKTDRWHLFQWSGTVEQESFSQFAFTKDTIKRFVDNCPLLQDLQIPTRRSKSDADEVAIYKSLSELESLRRLQLTLNWADHWNIPAGQSNPARPHAYEGYDAEPVSFIWELDGRIKNGHIKDALRNAAMDAPLAVSIWNTIRERHGVLNQLELHIESIDNILNSTLRQIEFMYMIASLTRSFKIVSSCKDGECGPMVTELSKHNQKELEQTLQHHGNTRIGRDPLHFVSAFHVFRSLWPRKEGSSSWREDWSSIPLYRHPDEPVLDTSFTQVENGDGCFRSALQQMLFDRAHRLPTDGEVERVPAV